MIGILVPFFLFASALSDKIHITVKEPHILQSVFPQGFDARIIMWGKQATFENLEIGLRTADPEDGCESYNFKPYRRDTAYLVTGLKSCPLSNLIHNAQSHGAKALFIVNNKDGEVDNIVIPDHLSGVGIHIFVITQSQGQSLIDVTRRLNDENPRDRRPAAVITIEFIKFVKRQSLIELDLIHTPENLGAMKFIADLYESKFSKVVGSKIHLNLHYAMLHCDQCRDNGYKVAKPDCLSGGRYCWRAEDGIKGAGETVLVQMIKNRCAEVTLKNLDRSKEIGDYFWLYEKNCLPDLTPDCSNAILNKMGIKEKVFTCIEESFEQAATKKHYNEYKHPNIQLQDNKVLREEKKYFKKIEHFAHFPLLKVNGMVYSGPISLVSVFGFICQHIDDSLDGCDDVVRIQNIYVSSRSSVFEWLVMIIVGVAVISLIWVCRVRLKRKFQSELSYQIDQSVNQYLQRTGTEL